MSNNNVDLKQKKKSPAVKILIAVLVLAVLAGGSVFYYVNHVLNKIERIDPEQEYQMTAEEAEQFEKEHPEEESPLDIDTSAQHINKEFAELEPDLNNKNIKLVKDPNVTNVLLIGCDSRTESFVGRSDTIMIFSINKNTGSVTIVSILRDTYVSIDGYKNNKINASYAFGGTKLLDKTIEKNLGVHIDYNVLINFQGFIKAMVEVGDIDISLSKAEAEYLNTNFQGWELTEGVNTLTPKQMLEYVRIRHINGDDWGRTERQRKVIMAAFNKYRSMGLSAVMDLIDRVTPYVRTDMTNAQILSCAQDVISGGMNISKAAALPTGKMYRSMYVRERAVLVPDMAEMSKALHQYLYGVD